MIRLPPRLLALQQRLRSEKRSSEQDHVGATVALLLHENEVEEEDGISTLLIQRIKRSDDPWSGQIGLPGGRVKDHDGSIRHTLKREVLEEVGVNLDHSAEELGPLSLGAPMRQAEFKVQPWAYGVEVKPEIKTGPEVDEAFWVRLSNLASNATSAEVMIRGERREVPAYVVEGKIVWGFTHRVLSELLQIPEINT